MSEKTTNPLLHPEVAAHEVILELIKAGRILKIRDASECFTFMLDHYRSELKRVQNESKGQ
jgi:hypothetical protein